MFWKNEWKKLAALIVVFLACYFLPLGAARFDNAILEALYLVKWYAQEHVLLCLVPAFFIAGAIGVFISQTAVMRYLGPTANKGIAYAVASVSGTLLAVCSCTVLPLFAGIYRMGAGLGPAIAFLYSGPAINVLAIILTARILGPELGVARAVGAILFSVVIGLCMHGLYRHEEKAKATTAPVMPEGEDSRPLGQTILYFATMVGILVFANWGRPEHDTGIWATLYAAKWGITGGLSLMLGVMLYAWMKISAIKIIAAAVPTAALAFLFPHQPLFAFSVGIIGLSVITSTEKGEAGEWFSTSWTFAKQIMPLLLLGVFIAGALLGRPEHEGLIPSAWIANAVGGNGLGANLFASIAGAFMYFATLTEVPIVQGLVDNGMGQGPALALLLAGPALSLPNMLVIRSVIGTSKTITFATLVVIMATLCGMLFGTLYP